MPAIPPLEPRKLEELACQRVLQALLLDLLGRLRRCAETPLLEGLDSLGIATSVWQQHGPEVKAALGSGPLDATSLAAALNLEMERSWAEATEESDHSLLSGGAGGTGPCAAGFGPDRSQSPEQVLAVWLEAVPVRLRDVPPQAIKIMVSCLQGYTKREIARQLDLTPRLVRRILGELRQAWHEG